MKIDAHKLSSQIISIGGPLVLAALAHKLATGKFDLKELALDAATQAVAARAA